jgi:hypothetical protein
VYAPGHNLLLPAADIGSDPPLLHHFAFAAFFGAAFAFDAGAAVFAGAAVELLELVPVTPLNDFT